jgi:hypothetical protein
VGGLAGAPADHGAEGGRFFGFSLSFTLLNGKDRSFLLFLSALSAISL